MLLNASSRRKFEISRQILFLTVEIVLVRLVFWPIVAKPYLVKFVSILIHMPGESNISEHIWASNRSFYRSINPKSKTDTSKNTANQVNESPTSRSDFDDIFSWGCDENRIEPKDRQNSNYAGSSNTVWMLRTKQKKCENRVESSKSSPYNYMK